MQPHPNEFFPDYATWPFFEQSTLEKVEIELESYAAGGSQGTAFVRSSIA
jgi:hypothetical protein